MLKSLECIADENSNILILGTFPSEASRKAKQFYGNKRNQFWKLLFEVFNEQYSNETSYEKKTQFLLKNNIALWDVIHTCETARSLDSEIKNPTFNDIPKFLSKHPKITKIFCNGKMVYNLVKKMGIEEEKINVLPSSSPTNTMKYVDKLNLWKSIILNM